MTTEEFSNEFDTLLNSYFTVESFGRVPNSIEVDEYEKSVFLTKAQEDVIISLYNGKNNSGDSFEKTEEIRRYLDDLVKTYSTSIKEAQHIGVSSHSTFFKLPEDLWFITYESVNLKDEKLGCKSGNEICVIPVTQDEYHRISRNPFRGPGIRRVLRLDIKGGIAELISKYNIESYLVRYLSKPTPIILEDLPDNLSINGVNKRTDCILNSAIHRTILERAVRLVLISKSSTIESSKK